jgi:hypothetical protein
MTKLTDQLFEEYWNDPGSKDALRVWADALIERGDPRGEYVQICLEGSPAKDKRRALEKKLGGKLVGPAREYLREWSFGPDGLVESARCEAVRLAAGAEEIGRLNPHLMLTVTSLKKKTVYDQLAKVSLHRIHCVDFTRYGGTQVKDKALAAVVPALSQVRNLAFSCRGYGNQCFSPDTLRALGEAHEGIEFLFLDYYQAGTGPYEDPSKPRLAPIEDYAEVIVSSPGFQSLKVLYLPGADPEPLRASLPNLVKLETSDSDGYDVPYNPRELERLKIG